MDEKHPLSSAVLRESPRSGRFSRSAGCRAAGRLAAQTLGQRKRKMEQNPR
jgi:hypothetical protein